MIVTERSDRKRPDKRAGEPRSSSSSTGGNRLPAESERGLTFLARLAAEFTTVLSLTDLLDHVIHVMDEEAEFDSCAISLLTKQNTEDVLVIRAASGLRASVKGNVLARGQGIAWVVIENGIPLLIPDVRADPRWFLRDSRIRSSIYAPLVVHRRPIGVVSAYRETVGGFEASDLTLLTVVSRYLAGAVEVARLHEQLKELAATDSLTGLANRRAFFDRLQAEIARSRRAGSEFCVALLDLDRFKAVNDLHGHAVGDQVLIKVAETLSQAVRQSDLAARFGGDEFILLMPDASRAQAMEMLARLRTVAIPIPDQAGRGIRTTFSWGIAAYPRDGEEPEQLLEVADLRLYAMKRGADREQPPLAPAGE
jgi:diguanylate cyclase (GGDEF)-like protein